MRCHGTRVIHQLERDHVVGQHVAMDSRSVRQEVVKLLLAAERAPGKPFPGGADDAELAELQSRLEIPLPVTLVDWLRVCKGDAIDPGGVYGVRPDQPDIDIAGTLSRLPGWRSRGWIPIAGDGCGDYYVLIGNGQLAGCVGFVDQSDLDEIDFIVASDLWLFLRFLLLKEAGDRRWPFDSQAVLAADPTMGNVPDELQPWFVA
jgi:hypothetical protein